MGEVYLKVVRVLVWFGPAEPSTARTFRRLALVGRLLTLEWKKKVSLSIFGPSEGLPQQVSSTQTPQLRLAEIYS